MTSVSWISISLPCDDPCHHISCSCHGIGIYTKCQSLCQSVGFGQGRTHGNGITRFQLGVDSKDIETVLVDKSQKQNQEMMACITLILFAPKSLFSLS